MPPWVEVADSARWIAVLNAALPDDSPHKVTWEWVDDLRAHASEIEARHDTLGTGDYMDCGLWERYSLLSRRAAALAAMLPPRSLSVLKDSIA